MGMVGHGGLLNTEVPKIAKSGFITRCATFLFEFIVQVDGIPVCLELAPLLLISRHYVLAVNFAYCCVVGTIRYLKVRKKCVQSALINLGIFFLQLTHISLWLNSWNVLRKQVSTLVAIISFPLK